MPSSFVPIPIFGEAKIELDSLPPLTAQRVCLVFPKSTFLIDPMVYPPLGLWYVWAELERMGLQVAYRDLSADRLPYDYDAYFISGTSPQAPEIRKTIAELRENAPGARILLGGSHAMTHGQEQLRRLGAHVVVQCEGDLPGVCAEALRVPVGSETVFIKHPLTPKLEHIGRPVRKAAWRYKATLHDWDGQAHPTTTMFTSRGCPARCAFCIAEGQRVLMADWTWRAIQDVRVGDMVMGMREGNSSNSYIAPTKVLAVMDNGIRDTVQLHAGGQTLRCTDDHRVYADDGHKTRWKLAGNCVPGKYQFRQFVPDEIDEVDYRRGWCDGYIAGDGCVHQRRGYAQLTVASRDVELLERLQLWGAEFGANLRRFQHQMGAGIFPTKQDDKFIEAVQCTRGEQVAMLLDTITASENETDDYKRGWLSGMYDADGYYDGHSCRIIQSRKIHPQETERIEQYLTDLGFTFSVQEHPGDVDYFCISATPFLLRCRPTLARKYPQQYLYRTLPKHALSAVTDGGKARVYDLTTEAHTFIAEGFIVHNCETQGLWGRTVRWTPFETVRDEIEEIIDLGFTGIMFYDDIFPLNKPRTLKMLDVLKYHHRHNGLIWRCFLRTDVLAKQGGYEYLRLMREAGLREVLAGVESASNVIKNNIQKGTTIEQDTQALRWCKELGILFKASTILGLPGETRETMQATLDWIIRERPDRADLNTYIPFPGTPITTAMAEGDSSYDIYLAQENMEDGKFPEEYFYKGPRDSSVALVGTSALTPLDIKTFRDMAVRVLDAEGIPY